jgi:tetratricopeptide (TPR) repeat protein
MSEDEDLFNEGMELFNQGNFYDAMSKFTASYNMTSGNTRALFYSAESTYQMAKDYLKKEDVGEWENWSRSAVSKFELCIDYSPNEEIKQKARERIQKIKELQQVAEEMKG